MQRWLLIRAYFRDIDELLTAFLKDGLDYLLKSVFLVF